VEKSDQTGLLLRILNRFSETEVLDQCMLIGSWCLYFYRAEFGKADLLSTIRTLDVDFLIPDPNRIKKQVDIPELLNAEGFIPMMNFSNGLVRYQHPDLLVEFLVPELGRGFHKPRDIRPWHIQAQEIRYLNFLTAFPKKIRYQNITVCVPEPAAFALHKLIVSSRRTKKEKREKDLAAAVGILEFLFKDPKEKARIRAILAKLPPKWRKTILAVSAKHFPELNKPAGE
jgi:hypothetical protein